MMSEIPPASRNIMLVVSYDGTNYSGWQVQPNGRTVQQCLETAIQKITGESVRVLCAGRTDSGVHALGQVASFRTNSRIPAARFRAAIQSELPRERDIVILESREVSASFHATHKAIRKTYRYLLYDGSVCPPFLRTYAGYSRTRLDADAMHAAAQHLRGTHDFRSFESQFPNKATSVRTVESASVARTQVWWPWSESAAADTASPLAPVSGERVRVRGLDQPLAADTASPLAPVSGERVRVRGLDQPTGANTDAALLSIEVTADGFLYNMMRAIVGTLQEIGEDKHPPEHMRDVIQSMDRINAGMTAAACGLYLVRVDYPSEVLVPEPQPQASER